MDLIIRIIDKLNLNNDRDLLIALLMLLCHNGLLRSGELFSGIQVKHIVWDLTDNCFTLQLNRSKRNRSGGPEMIMVPDYAGISAYKILRVWFDRHDLWNQPDSFIIPRIGSRRNKSKHIGRVKLDFTVNGSIYTWRTWIAKACVSIGLDPSKYSGHSFRAGGATDLFTARVPFDIIKKMGRWKSDSSCRRYYRDDLDIADAVSKAFGMALTRQVVDFNNRIDRLMGV